MTTTSSLIPTGGPAGGPGRLPSDLYPGTMPGASASAGALGGRELRCLIGPVGYVPAAEMARPVPGASRYSRPRARSAPANLQLGNRFRWAFALNGWSPIPDQWFASPEEARGRFWEAVG